MFNDDLLCFHFLEVLVRLGLVLRVLSELDVWAALKIQIYCLGSNLSKSSHLLDLVEPNAATAAGGVLSTKSSSESLAARFLLASFLTGELVAELLADSGVFSLFLFLMDDLAVVSTSFVFLVVERALVLGVDEEEEVSSTLFPVL